MKYSEEQYEYLNRFYSTEYEKDKILAKIFRTDLFDIENSYEEAKLEFKRDLNTDLSFTVFLAAKLLAIHKALLLFPDNEIVEKFAKYCRISIEEIKKFFISYENLEKHFKQIEEKGIRINKADLILEVKAYLGLKFSMAYAGNLFPTVRDNTKMSKLSDEFIKLRKRRKDSGSNPKRYKNVFEIFLNQSVNDFEKIPGDEDLGIGMEFNLDNMIEISKGRTERIFIKHIIQECFEYEHTGLTKTKFRAAIYDLIGEIITKKWITEDEFDEIRDVSYKSWDSYKAKKVKNLLSSNKKK